MGERVRVAALVHFAMPWRNAGSETVLHELLKHAAANGHETTCVVTDCGLGPPETFDGVDLLRVKNVIQGGRLVGGMRPDVIVSHHQHVLHALRTARLVNARSVYLIHNDMDLNRRPLLLRPDLVIFNSAWVRDSLRRFGTPADEFVMHPPLTPERHRVTSTGDAITLINLNEHKGSRIFYELARRNRDRKFLGVVGGHGVQIIDSSLPNVDIIEHDANMRRVWERTRTLLMPSIYESYGLVAVEAAVNGIPTIANRTPGLIENLGSDGLFAERDDLHEWETHLIRLDDSGVYAHESAKASKLADTAMTATRDTLNTWLSWLSQ